MPLRFVVLIFFIIEISLLITIGAEIGILMTLLEFVLSALLGMFLIREKGLRVINQVNREVKSGVRIEVDLMPTLMTVIGGLMLIIPGFGSDLFGVLLLLPFIKSMLMPRAQKSLNRSADRHRKRSSITIDHID